MLDVQISSTKMALDLVESQRSLDSPPTMALIPQPRAPPERSPLCGPLIEVGFWADSRDPDDTRPSPAKMVDEQWGATVAASAVTLYVQSGYLESFELGYSYCRFGCGRDMFMGCCTMTDGKYVWPEGLAHYITVHNVRPPDAFVERAISNLGALRESQAAGRLCWDGERRGSLRKLDPGTAVFLRDKTTLGIALPPEPEIMHHSDDFAICSCRPS